MGTDDDFNEEAYYSFSKPLCDSLKHDLPIGIRAKPSVISLFTGQINKKQTKLLCDVCIEFFVIFFDKNE